MDGFENLISAVIGAVAQVVNEVTEEVSIYAAALGAMADIANIYEDGKVDDEEEDRLLNDLKLVIGAFILGLFSSLADGEDESDDDEDSQSDFNGIQMKVTDGAAVTYNGDINSNYDNNWLNFVLGAEGMQERSDEMTQEGISQDANNIWNFYKDGVSTQEGIQEKSDEIEQDGMTQLKDYIKNKYDNMGDNGGDISDDQETDDQKADDQRDIVLLIGPGASYSNGFRGEKSAMAAIDLTHPDFDVLGTDGRGVGNDSADVSFGIGVAQSDGIPGLYGGGDSGGVSAAGKGIDYSHSSTSDALTASASLGSDDAAPEAHVSQTNTYSLMGGSVREKGEQVKEFKDGYIQHVEDQITGDADQDADEMTEEEKQKKEINDAMYNNIDDALGYNDH